MKNLKTIEEIKQEYGTVVANAATYNLLQLGLQRYDEKIKLSEQLKLINKIFDNQTDEIFFPLTKNFMVNVLNCQYDLLSLDKPMQLMTYFSKPTNKEEDN